MGGRGVTVKICGEKNSVNVVNDKW